jgi:sigma-B regulation protein RsbU (phosphoserine phosphatase)
MNNIEYNSCETVLAPGDNIFLYTDGITEAIDKNEEFYGEKRLADKLNSISYIEPNNVLSEIAADVETYSAGMAQTDDITMLALKYNGANGVQRQSETTILLPAKQEKYSNLMSWLDKQCDYAGLDTKHKNKLCIAVEEIFLNVSNYAYPPIEGDVEISFKINDNNQIEMKFADSGVQYNPLEKDDPDITLNADERSIGGLGIFMVKKSMDEVNYSYENGKNVLTIKMNF